MTIGFLIPRSVQVVNGGVRRQATETAHHLEEHGLKVLWVEKQEDLHAIDLLHIFVASPEHRSFLSVLKSFQFEQSAMLPIVLSPVFFSPTSVGITKVKIQAERWLHPFLKGRESEYWFKSELCNYVDYLLPNTRDELHQVHCLFDVPTDRMQVIHNGVDRRFLHSDATLFQQRYGSEDTILFVGQAGSTRKNIKRLLEITPKLPARLVVIGDFGEDSYSSSCRSLMQKYGVLHIPNLKHEDPLLASAYASAKVFVLPSLFETPGIAAMEAALAGAQIALTERGGTHEYFGDQASYLNPYSHQSILNAIIDAYKRKDVGLRDRMATTFSWDRIAKNTLSVYQRIIG
ncbi:MAG: glycosyltransferase [Bacteroidota bacterium]